MIKKAKIIIGVMSFIVILLIVTFLYRGWIRSKAIPAYVNHFYKSGVDNNFDQDFFVVNQKLYELGFTFNNTNYRQDECRKGNSVLYEGFKETVMCLRVQTIYQRQFTTDFIDKWKLNSPNLESFLLTQGWHRQGNIRQPIAEIYNNLSNNVGVGVDYSKVHGKTECQMSIIYSASSPNQEKTYVNESCIRWVTFFGDNL